MKTESSVLVGGARTKAAVPLTTGSSRPVVVWGTIGAGFLAFNAYLYRGGSCRATSSRSPKGPSPCRRR